MTTNASEVAAKANASATSVKGASPAVAKYRYSGPVSGVTLVEGEKSQEVMLFPGAEVELPEGHEYVQTLQALGYLTPLSGVTRQPKTKGEADAR